MEKADREQSRAEDAIEGFISYLGRVEGCSPETVRAYRAHLASLLAWSQRSGVDVLHLGVRDLRGYLAELRQARDAPRTVAAHLAAIRSLFRWMVLEGIIETDAVATIRSPRLPRSLPRTLTGTQMDAFLAAPDTSKPSGMRDALMLELLYATGARISELAALDIDSFDVSGRSVRLFGKGSKERIIPLYRRVLAMLDAYLENGRPELVRAARSHGKASAEPAGRALFVSGRGARMNADALRYRFSVLARAAGLPADITPHAMRHTFATDLLANGADLRSVQELLGHVSLSTTQLYTHLTPERMRSALRQAHPRGQI